MKIMKEHIVNEENKIVVAVMKECVDTEKEIIDSCPTATACIALSLIDATNPLNGADPSMKAVARCLDEDDFSVEKGLEVASSKLDLKYHKRMVRDYDKYLKHLEAATEQLKALQKKHIEKVEVITKDMQEFYE